MKVPNSSSPTDGVYIVNNPEQARLLSNPETVRYFKPFVADTKTLSEAANELGCHLNTLYYRVQTFLKAGLLKLSHEQKRKGRAIKYYRSIKDEVFIPFSLTPYASIEEGLNKQLAPLWQQLILGMAKSYQQHGVYGRKIYRKTKGAVFTVQTTNPTQLESFETMLEQDSFFSDVVVSLSEEEALGIRHRLAELFTDVFTHSAQKPLTKTPRTTYTFQVALVPYEGSGS